MAGGFQSITIKEALNEISGNRFLLPAFQRDYVWKPKQVANLFDSIMRGYPINSMLFWQVRGEVRGTEARNDWRFYQFLGRVREYYRMRNDEALVAPPSDFCAVLDGQQRLTSLFLGLFGIYETHIYNALWKDEEKYFKKCKLYLNLSSKAAQDEDEAEYDFRWLNEKETNGAVIFEKAGDGEKAEKWLRCGAIFEKTVMAIVREFGLDDGEEELLSLFRQKIFDEKLINYYLEAESNKEKAVQIFVRTNSGGTSLGYSDILFSVAIANWKKLDARREINGLVRKINEGGFNISKDLVLKGFLFLYHHDIRYRVGSFGADSFHLLRANGREYRRLSCRFLGFCAALD